MRTDLRVPFAEKDEAKRLGARWDPARKVWYIQDKEDTSPFARWMPTAGADSFAGTPARTKAAPAAGMPITGSKYAPQPRVCDCLPWEVCDKCRGSALSYENSRE